MKKTLVIGYGNTLRSDDGVGVWIADKIASLDLPGAVVKTYHQLGFELVEEFALFDKVIFVDAAATGEPISYRFLVPYSIHSSLNEHNVTPEALQAMAYELFGERIEMYLFTVLGKSFDFGWEISPSVQERALQVTDQIVSLLPQSAQTASHPDFILN